MKKFILLLIPLFISACGGYREGVVLRQESGFMQITGDRNDVSIAIDDGEQTVLSPDKDTYQIVPGRHEIKLYRKGTLIISKSVIIASQTTTEISLP